VRDAVGELPCNVKFIIEGEEEMGSPNMPAFVEKHQEKLAADACIWEFGSVDYEGTAQQALGMRGICYVELSVQTADIDAHSGLGGSIFPNAAWRLTWALSTLKDQQRAHPHSRLLRQRAAPSRARFGNDRPTAFDEAAELKAQFGLEAFCLGMEGVWS
jgi:hypothetical protein